MCSRGEVGVEDVRVGLGCFEEEPKDVLVEFVAFSAHLVVLPQLVVPVDPAHIPSVFGHCRRAAHIHLATIVLSPLNYLFLVRLGVGGEYCHYPVVTPQNS